MDELARLISAFGSHDRSHGAAWKLDILMDLGRFDGPRVVALYAAVVADNEEPPEVRADALRRLREASLTPNERVDAADAGLRALVVGTDPALRLHAALALGDFVEVPAVLAALGRLAADAEEPIDLRYNAFTSLQRAGPIAACLEILRALTADEVLGQSATTLLAVWEGR
jgi:hypothetical protein